MDIKELKKANGDVFFEAARQPGNSYIHVNWIGIQSVETIMMGATQLLNMLRQESCPKILNSQKELIGPWEDGALYLGSKWAPHASLLGVLHFAQVLPPGIYGQRSFQHFYQLAQKHFQIETFTTDEEAEAWLLS
ncbi:MAG: hypothetical protein JWQ14_1778 [Adhaeribacter sp.]|jgi:hypothetical protein|nr:hypothetical protein [Adhaeribacter sp.]